jgi:hypothetical protein
VKKATYKIACDARDQQQSENINCSSAFQTSLYFKNLKLK